MQTIVMKSRAFIVPQCSSKKLNEKSINAARKRFESKRAESLKDNANKLLAIANSDVKEYGSFLKELDELHKKELGAFVDKFKNRGPKTYDSKESTSDSEENIFVDKE